MSKKMLAGVKAVLKNGEARGDFIKRRWLEGIEKAAILDEINSLDLYTGPADSKWQMTCIYAALKGVERPVAAAAEEVKPEAKAEAVELSDIQTGDDMFSADEIAEIERQALSNVQKDMKKKGVAERLKAAEDRIRHKLAVTNDPNERLEQVYINLPDCQMPCIQLELPWGPKYYDGQTYQVRAKVAAMLRDIMARGWDLQARNEGKRQEYYRSKQAIVSSAGLGRGVSA